MKEHLVILGGVNYDITASAAKLPEKGETVNGFRVDMFGGGKGANQAVQCARTGVKSSIIGLIGNDMQGQSVRASLEEAGLDCNCLFISKEERTACASIYIDTNGDNVIVYAPGANHHLTRDLIDRARPVIEDAGVYLTQLEVNLDACLYGLELARRSGAVTILNPAPAAELSDDFFALADYITPNETESEFYTKIFRKDMPLEEWTKRTADWFLSKGAKHLCITMGEKGAFYADASHSLTVPAFPIQAVDTTAAGDSFHGGLAYGLLKGYDIQTCLCIGNACGGLSAMTLGAQSSIPTFDKIQAFLLEHGVTLQRRTK